MCIRDRIDSTKLDVLGRDIDGNARRFELTIALDKASRAVVAYRITENDQNGIDAAQMLAKILTPEPMREGWEERLRFNYESIPIDRLVSFDERFAKAARSPVVFPDTIVMDNGKVFLSHAFLNACQQLGISVYQARPGTGHDKALVERMFRTINPQFTEYIKGFVGSSPHLRGKKDPPASELFTVEELNELFGEYLIRWHGKVHEGLQLPHFPDKDLSPNDYFESAAAAFGFLPRPVSFSESITLLPAQEREIHAYGVEINKRIYDAEELHPFRNLPNSNNENGKWVFHADPDQLLHVYFYNEEDDEVIAIPLKGCDRINQPFAEKQWQQCHKLASSPDVVKRHAQAILLLEELQNDMRDGSALKALRARAAQRQKEHDIPMGTPTRMDYRDDTDLEESEDDDDGIYDEEADYGNASW